MKNWQAILSATYIALLLLAKVTIYATDENKPDPKNPTERRDEPGGLRGKDPVRSRDAEQDRGLDAEPVYAQSLPVKERI